MTLPECHQEVEGRIYRQHQYDIDPLRVIMTARVIPAALSVEYHDDEGLQYNALASDLLNESNQVRSFATMFKLLYWIK